MADSPDSRTRTPPHPLWRGLSLLRGRGWLLTGALLTTLVISAGQLAGPKLKQIGIDDGIRAGDARLLGWVVVVALDSLATVVAGYFQAS